MSRTGECLAAGHVQPSVEYQCVQKASAYTEGRIIPVPFQQKIFCRDCGQTVLAGSCFVFPRFGELLPSFASDEHRQGEISNLIAAFWKMLQDVGADLSAVGGSYLRNTLGSINGCLTYPVPLSPRRVVPIPHAAGLLLSTPTALDCLAVELARERGPSLVFFCAFF